jgi:four helix bundle protein
MSKEKQMIEGQNSQSNNNSKPQPKYDLEERTAQFGEAVIGFARTVPVTPITETPLGQVVRSCTSIGANYCEADDAGSKKEFRYRISLSKRESRESKHWLHMLAAAVPDRKDEIRPLWREAKELNLIFAAIHRGKKQNRGDNSEQAPGP